ncbi:MAG: PQQ-binding-like beta-propeller repeat protein [Anaerolineae bacterium]
MARWQLIVLVVILSGTLASCANVRQGVAWPDLELVTINDQPRVLIVYDGQIEAIDPYQGAQVHVIRDADGAIVLDENNNAREWIIRGNQLDGAQFFTSPLREDDTFLFPTYNGRMLTVDVQTATVENVAGIPLTDGVIADPVVSDELIYVPYRSQDVVALDHETYEEVWRFSDTEGGVWASPLLYDGVLYVTSIDHFLYAIDAQTGEAIWDQPVDLEGAVASTPAIYNDYLYVGSYSHDVYQISLDGEIVNSYEGNNWVWSTPVIEDDILYYTDLSGYVYALNATDLSEIWVVRPSNRGIRPGPILTDNFVVVATRNGNVYWLSRETGSTVQEAQVENRPELLSDILYLPADADSGRPELMLVASTENRRLVSAFNMETFSLQWVYQR